MIQTILQPDYYAIFPNYQPNELHDRLRAKPLHIATLLGLKNMTTTLAERPLELTRYLNSSFTTKRHFLCETLRYAGIPSDITDALARIPREHFAPMKHRQFCYLNHYVPFSNSSCLSAPGLVALMIDRLQAQSGQRILEIGIGSGFHAAWISEILSANCEIIGVELGTQYALHGRSCLAALGFKNIEIRIGDAGSILSASDQFDRIYATASLASGFPRDLIVLVRDGGVAQYVRALTREEFEMELPDSWLLRTFGTFKQYINGDWRAFCCLATARREGDRLVEFDRVYDLTFVPWSPQPNDDDDPEEPDDPFADIRHFADSAHI